MSSSTSLQKYSTVLAQISSAELTFFQQVQASTSRRESEKS